MDRSVLIVDDAGFIREMLTHICEELGYVVVGEAMSGDEAIILANQLKPAIIFMDIVMPGKNGIDAGAEILKRNPHISLIALSSLEASFVQQKSKKVEFTHIITKPFTKSDIQSALSACHQAEMRLKHG
ncbi:MAG: chemotaxis protein CheY [Oligoflexia bacterium]|nr:MAG: chemotaxis protein CheY [Oligoflexia bacterium]